MTMMNIASVCLPSLIGYATAFQPQHGVTPSFTYRPSIDLSLSYLDSLGEQQSSAAADASQGGSYLDSLQSSPPLQAESSHTTTAPLAPQTVLVTTTPPTPTDDNNTSPSSSSFAHASLDYFSLDKLTSKGPRATADWGTPQDATRKLAEDGTLRAGSWFCSEGGWPSPNLKAHTEIFYMLSGNGCLTDADGMQHYFGPGDVVIIPKGHVGRWDVYEPIHKVWAVNAHDRIEDSSPTIRVQVDHYHEFAPQYMKQNDGYDFLYACPSGDNVACRTLYDLRPTRVGVWTCTAPTSFYVKDGLKSFFNLLEGVVVVSNSKTGEARRCVPGDTVMLPEGWSGHVDVIEPAKKLWTTAE